MTDQSRDREGRYMHAMEAACVCGHRMGLHTAERVKRNGVWYQPCIAGDLDSIDRCDCQLFKKATPPR